MTGMTSAPMPDPPFTREEEEAAIRNLLLNGYEDGPVDIDDFVRKEIVALVLTITAARMGRRAYQAGREDAARSTCQENADPERFGAFVNSHMHECKREVGHHSKVHHCACGCEWWGTTLEGIDLGRSSRGVGDNTKEQQQEDRRG